MKKIIFILCLITSNILQASFLPENTAALVNGIAITNDEVDVALEKLLPKESYHSGVKKPKTDALKKKALNSLIDLTIFYSDALAKGIKSDDKKVQEMKNKLLEGADNSELKLAVLLERLGLNLDLVLRTYTRQLVLEKYYDKYIKSIPTDAQLKKYYEEYKYKFKVPPKIHLKMIYVKNEPTDPDGRQKAKKRAQEALSLLKEGADFAEVAQDYSDAMSRVKGGDLGMLHKGQLNPNVEHEAFDLKKGEMSGVIEKDVGCYIIKIIDSQDAQQLALKDVKEKLKKELQKKEETKKKEALLDNLKLKAKIIR